MAQEKIPKSIGVVVAWVFGISLIALMLVILIVLIFNIPTSFNDLQGYSTTQTILSNNGTSTTLSQTPTSLSATRLNQTWLEFDGKDNRVILNSDLGGAWSWFSTPLSVFYDGSTYTGYVNANGDVIINKYIHSTTTMSTFTLNTSLEYDDHDAPTILIKPDGRIMAFYTKHNSGFIKYRISTNPGDISAFNNEVEIPGTNGATYNNPIYLEVENLTYLFYRQIAGSGYDPSFMTYNGSSWSAESTVFSTPGERPYSRYATNDNDTIWFAFTDGHPDVVPNNSIYSFYYKNDSTTGSFYYANGTVIGTKGDIPFINTNLSHNTSMVYNANITDERAWIWDIEMDNNNDPHILYSIVEDTNAHYYRYATYNVTGDLWNNYNITNAGAGLYFGENEYSGGLSFDTKNVSIVYLSKKEGSAYEIEKWITGDNGATWTNTNNLTSGSTQYNIRPVSPKNHSNEINVSWMHGSYSEFTNYYTEIKTETINISPTKNMPILNNFSISVWAKWDGTTRSSEETIYSDWIGNSDFRADRSILLRWDSQDEEILLIIELSGGSEASQSFEGMNLSDKNWHHIVAMYNGTDTSMYMDGVISPDIKATSGNLETPNTLTSFGYAGFNKGDTFNGSLDNLKVYNRSLTANEVSTIYNYSRNGSVLDSNSITNNLKLNSNQGTTAYDTSNNGNNGTISGATWNNDGVTISLTEGIDYLLSANIFTLINFQLSWDEIIANFNYGTTNPAQTDASSVKENYGSSATNISGQFPIVGTIIGIAILLIVLIGILVYVIMNLNSDLFTSKSGGTPGKIGIA